MYFGLCIFLCGSYFPFILRARLSIAVVSGYVAVVAYSEGSGASWTCSASSRCDVVDGSLGLYCVPRMAVCCLAVRWRGTSTTCVCVCSPYCSCHPPFFVLIFEIGQKLCDPYVSLSSIASARMDRHSRQETLLLLFSRSNPSERVTSWETRNKRGGNRHIYKHDLSL